VARAICPSRVVACCYAVSGFVALGYQVVWLRSWADWCGSGSLTFGTVVSAFILGLGAGSLASRAVERWVRWLVRTSDRLVVYGVLELLLLLAVLPTLAAGAVPITAPGSFPYELHGGIWSLGSGPRLAQIGLITASVFVPCLVMGTTFPLLCAAYRSEGRFPARLYAWNTLGACLGVLACEFVLLPALGHARMLWVLLGLNGALGGWFLWRGGAPPAPEEGVGSRAAGLTAGQPDLGIGSAIGLVAAGGLVAGVIEGSLLASLRFLGARSDAAMAFVSFWAVLAIFAAARFVEAAPRLEAAAVRILFAAGACCFALVWTVGPPLRDWLVGRAWAGAIARATAGLPDGGPMVSAFFPSGLGQLLLFTGVLVVPPIVLVAVLLPWVCNRLQAQGRHLGVVYGVNTLAFCAGLLAFTCVAPAVDGFYAQKLAVVIAGIGAGVVLWAGATWRPWHPSLGCAAAAVACVATGRGFDPDYLPASDPARQAPVRALRADAAHTTYVVGLPDGDRLYFDSHTMTGTNQFSQVYMRVMAHFPLLCASVPRRALLICYGAGNTASAILNHDGIERLDVVELSRGVLETGDEFVRVNGAVAGDPRVRRIHDDGRAFLRRTTEHYDLITSEPPPPLGPGVYRLYSREYYADVRARLTPGGAMTQWLPAWQMPPEAAAAVVATFLDVFPHALLFVGHFNELLLLGAREPVDLRVLERSFAARPRARADLLRIGIERPLQLIARIVQGDRTLRAGHAGQPLILDHKNLLSRMFVDPDRETVLRYDPYAVLEEIGAADLQCGSELRAVVTHLGRLTFAVNFPPETLATVRTSARPVALAEAPWRAIRQLQQRYSEQARTDEERARILEQCLALAAEQPAILLELARVATALGRNERVLDALHRCAALEPVAVAKTIDELLARNPSAELRARLAALRERLPR
jgi:predicted membrane-bound spermidine synthase